MRNSLTLVIILILLTPSIVPLNNFNSNGKVHNGRSNGIHITLPKKKPLSNNQTAPSYPSDDNDEPPRRPEMSDDEIEI